MSIIPSDLDLIAYLEIPDDLEPDERQQLEQSLRHLMTQYVLAKIINQLEPAQIKILTDCTTPESALTQLKKYCPQFVEQVDVEMQEFKKKFNAQEEIHG